jgi:Cu(I)/Ag(I) efflux system membrane fusion protein
MPLVRAETLGFVSADDVNAKPPLVIPASAPLITGKRSVVYVELPDRPGTYQGREITHGARAGGYYLVREGLTEGERVVVNGNFKIDSAIQIRAEPSMMSPEGGGPAPGHHHGGEDQGASQAGHRAEASTQHDRAKPERDRLVVPEAFRDQLSKVFGAYFRIHTALSLDALKDAQTASKGAITALDGVDMALLQGPAHHAWMKELTGIRKSAANITAAGDIEKARSSFALLSESMIAVAKRFGTSTQPVYRFRCPMAFSNRGADWLQDKKQTANPYFGSAMFRCGSLKETIANAPAKKSAGGDGGK